MKAICYFFALIACACVPSLVDACGYYCFERTNFWNYNTGSGTQYSDNYANYMWENSIGNGDPDDVPNFVEQRVCSEGFGNCNTTWNDDEELESVGDLLDCGGAVMVTQKACVFGT